MADTDRPPIPSGIKRQVRQKCKFGCVMCGNPICDVDHIDEYSVVQEHELDNLTLLCTMHHRQKTSKVLSPEVVRERTKNIIHARGGLPDLNFAECKLVLGNNAIHTVRDYAFKVQGKDFFKLGYDKDLNQIVVNAAFYDRDGKVAFKVENNIYWTTDDAWDVEVVGNRIIFREGPNKVYLTVTLDGIGNVVYIKGKIFIDDTHFIELNDKGIQCNGYTIADNIEIEGSSVGIFIGEDAIVSGMIAGVVGMGANMSNVGIGSFPVGFAFTNEEIIDAFSYPKGKD